MSNNTEAAVIFSTEFKRLSYPQKLLHGFIIPMSPLAICITGVYSFPPVGGQGCGFEEMIAAFIVFIFIPIWTILAILLLMIPWKSIWMIRVVFMPPPLIVAYMVLSMWPTCARERERWGVAPAVDTTATAPEATSRP